MTTSSPPGGRADDRRVDGGRADDGRRLRSPTGMDLIRVAAGLRVALLRGSFRAGPGAAVRRLGLVSGALIAGGLALAAFFALVATRGNGRLGEDAATVLFTVLVIGWVVLPVVTFGSDDLLDPARLAVLPLNRRQLLTVMGVGALIGVAPVATAVAALGLVAATATGPVSALVGLVAVVLLLLLCVAASRACTSALSGLLRSRRGRDLGVTLSLLLVIGFQFLNPLIQLGARNAEHGEDAVRGLATPLRWLPTGLLATAPGRPLPIAAASLLAVAGVVVLLLVAWERSVRRSLERSESAGSRRHRHTDLEPAGVRLPAGRTGAIAAKDLRYLGREPRRLLQVVIVAVFPVLAVVIGPLVVLGGRLSPPLVFLVAGIGLFGGLSNANRFGVDGTASWLLVSSATHRRDALRDLVGGDVASAWVTVPLMAVLGVLAAAVVDGWTYLPAALGLGWALYLAGLGISGMVSVSAPVAVPPTQNAFGGGGAGQGCSASLIGMAGLLAEVVLCLPLLALLLPLLLTGAPAWGLALLVVGPVYGFLVGGAIRRVVARRWQERGPEVLAILAAAR